MMADTLINIGGQTVSASSVTMPSTGRDFRDAWTLNGSVIEVDMVQAREIKIARIAEKAQEKIAKAELQAAKKAIKGESTTDEDAEISKFKAKPKQAGIDLVMNAATPEELTAITEDQVYA